MPHNVKYFDGRMFMWDGKAYEAREQILAAQKTYEGNGFETRLMEGEGTSWVYTRRVAAVQTATGG